MERLATLRLQLIIKPERVSRVTGFVCDDSPTKYGDTFSVLCSARGSPVDLGKFKIPPSSITANNPPKITNEQGGGYEEEWEPLEREISYTTLG